MPTARQQSGAALVLLLLGLLIIGSYLSYRNGKHAALGPASFGNERQSRLQRAKEALIARAVSDANRPGSLPCPDLLTDSNSLSNHPHDGKSDLLSGNDCPSYIGWLPWHSLDLPELADESGEHLWYVLARALRDDDSAQPINSNTPTSLLLDGRPDIAALIIAPGPALAGQNRPSNRPADYLEGNNANGTESFSSGPPSAQFNDLILAITRQELMHAVEQRVTGELRACLEQHATSSANRWQETPWPAPFSNPQGHGPAGSYFGQVPLTQADNGPQAQLAASKEGLQNSRAALLNSTPSQQLAALENLSDQLAFAKIFYDRLYSSARNLALLAGQQITMLGTLASNIDTANSKGRISTTDQRSIASTGETSQSQFAPLLQAISDSGLDFFPDELSNLNLALQNASTQRSPALLQTSSADLLGILNASFTTNPALSSALNNSRQLGSNSLSASLRAQAAPNDAALLTTALTTAEQFKLANEQLLATLASNRSTLLAEEVNASLSQLSTALEHFSQMSDSTSQSALNQQLVDTQTLLSRLNTSSLAAALDASLNALNAALASAASNDWPQLLDNTRQAMSQSSVLSNALQQLADNLTKESLNASSSRFNNELNAFNSPNSHTATELLPYAANLRQAAADLQLWAELINRQASDLATLARKSPAAGKTQSNPASVYSLADSALNSITKANGSLNKMQDYLDSPTSSRLTAAQSAITDTLSQLDQLLRGVDNLAEKLHSSTAAATPVLWYGERCAFLQPGSESTSWWTANAWRNTLFYQMSNRTRRPQGSLQVNGKGSYHHVVISAGQALAGQNRQILQSSSFFEGPNADSSRNDQASQVSTQFVRHPASTHFNDQLAY